MVEIRRKALENIQSPQSQQKRYYDAKHCKDIAWYDVGSLVLLMNSKTYSKKGWKLHPNWTGPYVHVIQEVLPKGVYCLRDPNNPSKVLAHKVNHSRLKLYFQQNHSLSTSSIQETSSAPVPQCYQISSTTVQLPSTSLQAISSSMWSIGSTPTLPSTSSACSSFLTTQKEVQDVYIMYYYHLYPWS